jgi:hypothetical protein
MYLEIDMSLLKELLNRIGVVCHKYLVPMGRKQNPDP